jgi:hypothetical protein
LRSAAQLRWAVRGLFTPSITTDTFDLAPEGCQAQGPAFRAVGRSQEWPQGEISLVAIICTAICGSGFHRRHQLEERAVNVLERVETLKRLGIRHITQLPEMGKEEEAIIRGKKVRFITWHDQLPSGEHRVVVACYEPHALASYRIEAAGFAIDPAGRIRELSDDEIDSFR